MKTELSISTADTNYVPNIETDVTVEWERKGSPGKLTFSLMKDPNMTIEEGNLVKFKVNDEGFFMGYIFNIKESKNELMQITVYDQLRYLKNKDTYWITDKKASEFIKTLFNDFNLKSGDIEDTGYKIPKLMLRDKTLFDMIQGVLDLTLTSNKKLFVMYDNFGKIDIKDIQGLKLDLIIGDDTAEDYETTSSIDNTYNQVKLAYPNEKTGKDEIYLTKDSSTIKKYGLLQYYEVIDEQTNGKAKADALLGYYNQVNKTLSVNNALGDIRVRAGYGVTVVLKDKNINAFMLVERVKHTFSNDEHLIDCNLRGNLYE